MKLTKGVKIFIGILVSEVTGIASSIFTMPGVNGWYVDLVKGPLNPPSWVFGPVWTILYALMGVAAGIVWSKSSLFNKSKVKTALNTFGVQLILNFFWSIIFFGLRMPGLAVLEILALWGTIYYTIILFMRISKPAAYLLVPYLAWVTFASFLNFSIWILN